VFWGGYFLLEWPAGWLAVLSITVLLPLVPMIFRYSRVIWIYFDRWSWPEERR
jgi:hypothetical protein